MVRSSLLRVLAAVALLFITASTGGATPIVTGSLRQVVGFYAIPISDVPAVEMTSSSATSGQFVEEVDEFILGVDSVSYVALQDTTLSPLLMGGTGVAFSELSTAESSGRVYAHSLLDAVFTLDGAYTYTFSGSLEAVSGQSYARLATGTSTTIHEQNGSVVPLSFAYSGLLGPGDYSFQLFAVSDQIAEMGPSELTGHASFNDIFLTLTPVAATAVPEPASVTLLSLGLAAAAARARRRTR